MAVTIDTVYQRVLAIANKEQRGYITPQEFNLFAGQAQMKIFEQYFYDINQFRRVPSSDDSEINTVEVLEDKVSIFYKADTLDDVDLGTGNAKFNLPDDFYRTRLVRTSSLHSGVDIQKLSATDFWEANQSPLTKGTATRPNYYQQKNEIWVNPGNSISPAINQIYLLYIKKPENPKWTYNVVAGQALYNSGASDHQDFELHPSEETSLVNEILELAGIMMEKPSLVAVADREEDKKIQQEKL